MEALLVQEWHIRDGRIFRLRQLLNKVNGNGRTGLLIELWRERHGIEGIRTQLLARNPRSEYITKALSSDPVPCELEADASMPAIVPWGKS